MAKLTPHPQTTANYYTQLARTYPVYLGLAATVVSIAVFTQTMKEIKFPTKQTKYDTQWKARALPAADVPTELLMKKAREEQQQQQAKTK